MESDDVISPRRPLPNLPPLSSTHKPRSLEPIMPTTLGDLSEIENSAENTVHKKRRRRRRAPTSASRNETDIGENLENGRPPRRQDRSESRTDDNIRPTARSRRRTRKTSRSNNTTSQPHQPLASGDGAKVFENFALTPMVQHDDVQNTGFVPELRSVQNVPDTVKEASAKKNDIVYIQRKHGFKSRTNEWLQEKRKEDGRLAEVEQGIMGEDGQLSVTCRLAIKIIKSFDYFTFFIHSLLAGISIWQILLIMVLASKGTDNFFEQYKEISVGVHVMFKVTLLLCFISALDRFDFGYYGFLIFPELLKANSKAWMVLSYFIALVFETVTISFNIWIFTNSPVAPTDDSNLWRNATVNSNYLNDDPQRHYTTWLVLNIIKTVFIVFGWFLLSADPKGNNTVDNIFTEENQEVETITKASDLR